MRENFEGTALYHRVGEFYIDERLLQEYPSIVMDLLENILIVRAEYHFDSRSIMYTGYCEDFELADPCVYPPTYTLKYYTINNQITKLELERIS